MYAGETASAASPVCKILYNRRLKMSKTAKMIIDKDFQISK